MTTIPVASITEISYGQDVHRCVGTAIGLAVVSLGVALMLLARSKKHVGITWINGKQKGGFVMQRDKNDYRGVLLGLEDITGKKAVDSDAMTVKD